MLARATKQAETNELVRIQTKAKSRIPLKGEGIAWPSLICEAGQRDHATQSTLPQKRESFYPANRFRNVLNGFNGTIPSPFDASRRPLALVPEW